MLQCQHYSLLFVSQCWKNFFVLKCYIHLFGQVCSAQAISGTGSLRLGMEFLKKFYHSEVIYVSNPTWGETFFLLIIFKCDFYVCADDVSCWQQQCTGDHQMELKIIVIKENKFRMLTNDHFIQGDCFIRCCLIQVQL